MKSIVSILSDQLIPNVLFIKQMLAKDDFHFFISTIEMENENKKKSSILADCLGLTKEQYRVIVVDANSPELILEVLDNYPWRDANAHVVNITGGTKMMSQMTYIHFSEKKNTEIYYWPIGSNDIEKLHPDMIRIKLAEVYQLDLKTYFAAHGYDYTCQKPISYPFSKADALFNKVVRYKSANHVQEINLAKAEDYHKPDKQYYLGAWFEEWMYCFLKKELQLSNEAIALNVKLKNRQSVRRTESDNEIDVAFVYLNKLFIWECKVFYTRSATGEKISNAVYKISSVSQSLGIQATSLVALLMPFGNNQKRKDFLQDITKLMRVRVVFSLEDMQHKESFLKNIFKIIGKESLQ